MALPDPHDSNSMSTHDMLYLCGVYAGALAEQIVVCEAAIRTLPRGSRHLAPYIEIADQSARIQISTLHSLTCWMGGIITRDEQLEETLKDLLQRVKDLEELVTKP